jgi:hypothetical protein
LVENLFTMRDRIRKRPHERLRRATLPGGLVAKPPKVRFWRKAERLIDAESPAT